MNITDIRIRRTYPDARLKALVSITLDGDFAVHDIKVIEGPTRLFVAMPSRKDDLGGFRDIVHPITPEARQMIETGILEKYYAYLAENTPMEPPTGPPAHEPTEGDGSLSQSEE